MNYSFEYIDIILLAMIVGFIFLRLRGILGRRNGNEEAFSGHMTQKFKEKTNLNELKKYVFDDNEKERFIKGAKLAYETIITSFGRGELNQLKHLLEKNIYKNFSDALEERKEKKIKSETTFVGIKSTKIKDFSEKENTRTVTVDFISEIITFSKNYEDKIISGDPEKIKVVSDTWKFSKDLKNNSPNWLLIQT